MSLYFFVQNTCAATARIYTESVVVVQFPVQLFTNGGAFVASIPFKLRRFSFVLFLAPCCFWAEFKGGRIKG